MLSGSENISISTLTSGTEEVVKYDGDSWSSRYRNTGNSPKDFKGETEVPEDQGN